MKRAASLLALLASGCMTMEPKLGSADPAIPASWPVGSPNLAQAEASLPAVTYQQIFTDPRLQTLIAQALVNNRDLMVAASNIAAAREQYNIQRAQQLPQLGATGGATVSGNRSSSTTGSGSGGSSSGSNVRAQYQLGLQVPSFEIDLFGRLRSLTRVQLEQYFATEAGARATRLTLVANIANTWLDYATDSSLLLVSQQTVDTAQRSVRLTRLRLEGGIAPRTDLSQAMEILSQAEANLAQQRTLLAQDVNALQLLVGAPIAPTLLPASIDQAGPTVAEIPAGVNSYVLLRRPDVLQAEFQMRAANADIGAARAALFPKITLTGLLGFASSALTTLFTGGAFGWQAGANAAYTIFQGGAGHANVRLTEAQRNAALASYQRAIQTAFREVSDALARRATMDAQLAATGRQQAAAADVVLLEEARYRAGIDSYLSLLDAQRSYYTVQQALVQTKRTAAQNRVALYQSLGGDSFIANAPLCPVSLVTSSAGATLATQCPNAPTAVR
ncbi:MAG: outer membrane protein multidrug efflux system [Sphingomonadales bacterium]|nr:outer membrane protein multidrug efflux system [Sphingomonadales bacterium]